MFLHASCYEQVLRTYDVIVLGNILKTLEMNYAEFDKSNKATLVSYGTTFIMDL